MFNEKNGHITKNFFVSDSPVKNSIETLIETEEFIKFLLENIPLAQNRLHIYLSVEGREKVIGPYRKAQVCKEIGCAPKRVNKYLNSNKRYKGYYINTKE